MTDETTAAADIAGPIALAAVLMALTLSPAKADETVQRLGDTSVCTRNGHECDRSWHLLTQSEGGTISLLKDLTKHECEFAMHRAKGEPATEEEIANERRTQAAIEAQAQDLCAHPEKNRGYLHIYCKNGASTGWFWDTSTRQVQPGDIKSAECFQ